MNKYADKTSAERSVERWEGEGGEVLPTGLRIKERAAFEKQENKDGERRQAEEASDNSLERKDFQKKSD